MNPDSVHKSKLVAFLAYHVGSSVLLERTSLQQRDNFSNAAQGYLNQLEDREASVSTLRRKIFFVLVLAEIYRASSDLQHRVLAMELSEQLEDQGEGNPFEHYMTIVNFTTEKLNTGNFGDLSVGASQAIRNPLGDRVSRDPLTGEDFVVPAEIHQWLELDDAEARCFESYLGHTIHEMAGWFDLEVRQV